MEICADSFVLIVVTVSVFLIRSSLVHCQTETKESRQSTPIRPGRYIPELYETEGKYKIDLRGKYKHIPVIYDGGYGDKGEKYLHDGREPIPYYHQDNYGPQYYNAADLGVSGIQFDPEADYIKELRFAVEVNYDRKHDCRIIELTWNELGKEKYHYVYRTQNPIVQGEKSNEEQNKEDELKEQETITEL